MGISSPEVTAECRTLEGGPGGKSRGALGLPRVGRDQKGSFKGAEKGRVTPSQRPGRRGRRDALTLCEYVQSVSHKHV